MTEWAIAKADGYPEKRQSKIARGHELLIANVLANFEAYLRVLELGTHPEQAKRLFPFIHDEKSGLVAIDQRPPKGGFQIRLYVFPHIPTRTVHVVAIGDKSTQENDIRFCHRYVKEIENA